MNREQEMENLRELYQREHAQKNILAVTTMVTGGIGTLLGVAAVPGSERFLPVCGTGICAGMFSYGLYTIMPERDSLNEGE